VVAGSMSDRVRPVVPFGIGMVLFSVGLIVGGLAPSMLILVLGRFLQGLGAGAMPAVSYVCIGRSYPPHQRPTMFALISSAWMLPSVIGPIVAAWVADVVGWRWVFLGLLPLCALIGALAMVGIRGVPAPAVRSDATNVLLAVVLAVGAGTLLVGLGASSIVAVLVVTIAGAVVTAASFRRLTPPGTLTARMGLPATVAIRGLLNFAFFAADAFVPFAIASIRGLSPLIGGLALTASAFLWTVGSWAQARWIERMGPRRLVTIGIASIAVGCVTMMLVLFDGVPAWTAFVWWGIAGFGMGLAYSPIAHVAMEIAGEGQEGRITTALQLSDTLGVALGTGVAGALVATFADLDGGDRLGVFVTFTLAAGVAVLGASLAGRIPGRSELA